MSSNAAPPAASNQNGPSVDIDLQAVEGIPRDTLIALLKRKNKDAKSVQAKLDKLEERYVKVVRFNKILMEDRTSFQRFCSELLPESDGIFEEAAAQESPVNVDSLLRRLAAWRSAFDAANEDRRVFQQFMELVFPGDKAVAQVFERISLGTEAFDILQQRWVVLEDLHNQSIASINAMAREQMMTQSREIEAANVAKQEAERKAEELREQLTRLAREKAQMLRQRLQGGGGVASDAAAATDAGFDSCGGTALGSGAVPSPTGAPLTAPTTSAGVDAVQLEELREARRAAERREQEVRDAAEQRERELRSDADALRIEARRLRMELEAVRDEGERHRAQTRQLVEEKDSVLDRLQRRMVELEEEVNSNAFITQCAEQQAGRDAEVKAKQKQVEQLNRTLAEIQKLLCMSYSQERVLKARIRELEQSHGRGHVAGDYLKHVVLKYIQYTQVGDMKAQSLVPVLCTLLNLSPEECHSVEITAIPQSLLLINQAVGGASSWLRGGASTGGERGPLAPDPLGDG